MSKKNRMLGLLLTLGLSGGFLFNQGFSANADFSPDQTQQIQTIIHDYLINNPKILLEMSQKLQSQEIAMHLSQAQKLIIAQPELLTKDTISPVLGNPKGAVTVVEFYDYQCSVCHQQFAIFDQVIKKYPNVRYVLKQMPIFGPASVYAEAMALYAVQQNKFADYHRALFNTNLVEGNLKNSDIDTIATQLNLKLPVPRNFITQAMTISNQNINLAKKLGLPGTPAFIVLPTKNSVNTNNLSIFLGYSSFDALTQAIQKAGR